jgi:hypothetical protein
MRSKRSTNRFQPKRGLVALLFAILASVAIAEVAFAEALVVVQVRGRAEGRVTLTARSGGQTFSCQTQQGTCRMDGVPGGSYSVQFTPARGQAPPPTQAMIPPTGTVTLHVAAAR